MSSGTETTGGARDPLAMLAAWREQGADRLNPIRFHFIEALSRRAAQQRGHARRVLDEKVATLVDAYQRDVDAAGSGGGAHPAHAQTGPLAELLAQLAAGTAATTPVQSAYPELPLLDYFRDTWSRYSTRHQLRQSQERVPENAGPLNSSLLVHRALSLMGEVAPEYLRHFLSYVDALSWMEQATRVDLLTDKDGARSASSRKSARGSR